MHHFLHFNKREVLQQEYSQPPILPSPRFLWVVNLIYYPPGVRSMKYCCLGVFRKEYFRLVTK